MADIRLRLIDWRPLRKGRLLGFASVKFDPPDLTVHEIPVLKGENGPWACMPTKPRLDAGGHQMCDVDGSPRYDRIISWPTRARARQFSDAVVNLVRRRHERDLD